MSFDRGYAKGLLRVPSPVGKAYHGDDGNTWGRWGLVAAMEAAGII